MGSENKNRRKKRVHFYASLHIIFRKVYLVLIDGLENEHTPELYSAHFRQNNRINYFSVQSVAMFMHLCSLDSINALNRKDWLILSLHQFSNYTFPIQQRINVIDIE